MQRIYQKLIKDLIKGEKFIYNNVIYDVEENLFPYNGMVNSYFIKYIRCDREYWFYLDGNIRVDCFKGEKNENRK